MIWGVLKLNLADGSNHGICGGLTRRKNMAIVSMRQMLEAGVHFGHQRRYWNPKMGPYIYGIRHRIHIINLEHTLPLFHQALKVVANIAANRGKVLFVGTKFAAQDIIREEATRCGMPYVNYRWLGGMLTNYKTIRQSIKRLKDLEAMEANNSFKGFTKKEMLNLMREKHKLELSLNGIKDMGGLPDALFVIDVGHERIALDEAKRLGIPVIGIVDTNNSPEGVDYLIPGNDDSIGAIRLYCQAIADTILEARSNLPDLTQAAKAEGGEEKAKRKVVTKKAAPKKPAASKNSVEANDSAKKASAAPSSKEEGQKREAAKKPAAKSAKPASKKAVKEEAK